MKMHFKYRSIFAIFAVAGLVTTTSCDDFLDREPISSVTPQQYFNTAEQLGNYAITYYTNVVPNYAGGWNSGPLLGDAHTDNIVYGEGSLNLYSKGRWQVPAGQNMGFGLARAMNFFLEQVLPKYEAGEITGSETDIKHYIGEVYVLRALYYYSCLRTFGDYPIITTVLPDEREALIEASKRMPRNEVARFILSDLDKAIGLLKSADEVGKVRFSRELALLLKSRVALFEGTFEKYHKDTPRVPGHPEWPGAKMDYNKGKTFNIDAEIDFFLSEAMKAAAEVADNCALTPNSKVLDPAANQIYGWNPYFEMFSMPDPSSLPEVLLYRQYSTAESVTYGYLNYIRSGGDNGMTKSFVDAFLMENGLPIYASNSGYQGDVTIDQQKSGRDGRLQLFLFGEKSVLLTEDTLTYFKAPLITAMSAERDRTGFRLRKHYCYDPVQLKNGLNGTNGQLCYRAAEAYLNYIEASYLKNGSIDSKADKYWRQIRERAGVDPDYQKTIAATDLSKEPDWAVYSGSAKVDPTLYNIRRERRCEFIGEGMRKDDLTRWRAYDALFEGNMGSYIPEGINLWTEIYKSKEYLKRDPQGNLTQESLLVEQADGLSTANVSSRKDSKYLRPYRIIRENNDLWNGYIWQKAHYLAPLGVRDLTITSEDGTVEHSAMYQNPYWPTVASASALE